MPADAVLTGAKLTQPPIHRVIIAPAGRLRARPARWSQRRYRRRGVSTAGDNGL